MFFFCEVYQLDKPSADWGINDLPFIELPSEAANKKANSAYVSANINTF